MAVLWILLLAVGLYLLLGLLYRRFWNKGLRAQLTFTQEYGVEGQESTLREVVENDKLLPLPAVEISFHMDKGLQFSQGDNSSVSDATYRRDIFALGPRQRITRSLDFVCGRRGYYRIDEAGLLARDLAMSQQFLTAFPQNTSFYVLPARWTPSASPSPSPSSWAASSVKSGCTTTPWSSPASAAIAGRTP